jgi:chromosome segregation ATPase
MLLMRLQERLDVTDARVGEIATALEAAKRILGTSLDEAEDRLGEKLDALQKRIAALEEQQETLQAQVTASSRQNDALKTAPQPAPSTPAWLAPVVLLVAASSVGSWIYTLAGG